MDGIRQYLLSVITAAIITGALTLLLGKKGTIGGAVKFLCGLYMTITVVGPFANFHLPDYASYLDGITLDAETAVAQGEEMSSQAISTIIKERTEAYILDKAKSLGLDISAEVILSPENMQPMRVVICGNASPYTKSRLKEYISEKLGIPEDEQVWT